LDEGVAIGKRADFVMEHIFVDANMRIAVEIIIRRATNGLGHQVRSGTVATGLGRLHFSRGAEESTHRRDSVHFLEQSGMQSAVSKHSS